MPNFHKVYVIINHHIYFFASITFTFVSYLAIYLFCHLLVKQLYKKQIREKQQELDWNRHFRTKFPETVGVDR